MKKINLLILLTISLNVFGQKVNDKIKLFENDLHHWDKSKNKKWTLKQRMDFYDVNAISIAVIKDYKVEWIRAYGYADLGENRKATAQTLFQAASISKSINSIGILKLAEDGKVNLDDDINLYLKTWKFPYDSLSKGKTISIAQLLGHKAGLSTGGFGGYAQGKSLPTTVQILDGSPPANSQAVRSIFEPGLKAQYSGGGTVISQLILENTTGERYENYMRKNILMPIGMGKSSFDQPPVKKDMLATGYSNGNEVVGKYHVYPEKAPAGLWSNPADLAKYIIETQLSLIGRSNKILSKELSKKRLDSNLGVFSIDYKGTKYFAHDGQNEGFVCSYVGSYEGGNGVVVMTNGNQMRLVYEVASSIAGLNHWKNYPLEAQKESIYLTIRKQSLKDVDKGFELYKMLKKDEPNGYNFSDEGELNQLGYELLGAGKTDAAIKILNLYVSEFPNSAGGYDSRAEAYLARKDYLLSKRDYLKSIELDPTNLNAREMLLKIEKRLKQ